MKAQIVLSLCLAATAVSAHMMPHKIRKTVTSKVQLAADDSIKQKWFRQISDHDNPHHPPAGINATFNQRYWIDTQYYKPGGPVIVLDGGETSGADRIPYMQTGIVRYLMEYVGGIGIILEHRYYGESHVTQNLSTSSLQLLTTKQALADNAYFAKNLHKYLPAEYSHITPETAPFISYGGSYAGAKSAFLQIAHPDAFYGSIASSAVIWAGEKFWEYYEPQRIHANRTCIRVIETVAERMDILHKEGGAPFQAFKKLFGVQGLKDKDAANVISFPLGDWQSSNWDTTLPGEKSWDDFCANITSGVQLHKEKAGDLKPYETTQGIRNYAAFMQGYINDNCLSQNSTIDQCFDTDYLPQYQSIALSNTGAQDGRIWTYQVCTEYGYFQYAAPEGHPSLVSRLVDLDYMRKPCQYYFGFPKSKHADTWKVNQYGSYGLTAPRLLFIDGNYDPWLYATDRSPYSPQHNKHSPLNYLIHVAWHHSDENGLGDISKEPARIQDVHHHEIDMVKQWVKEFHAKGY